MDSNDEGHALTVATLSGQDWWPEGESRARGADDLESMVSEFPSRAVAFAGPV